MFPPENPPLDEKASLVAAADAHEVTAVAADDGSPDTAANGTVDTVDDGMYDNRLHWTLSSNFYPPAPPVVVDPWAVEPGIPSEAYVSPSHAWCTGRAYAYPPSHDLLPVRVLAGDSNGYYAVTRGRMVGVFLNALVLFSFLEALPDLSHDSNLASEMVTGISNFANKRYTKQGDALNAFNSLRREGQVAIALPRESRPSVFRLSLRR